ncbi:MAG: hypothetical protein K2Y56_24140 [Methylobacterium sp.]|uniref:hypothetical protein n=1 Tax=Methylobacterium sp. TaxID=409 RepID=UPI0025F6883A|nr:hypothetical protein [Methylobacterium sp.]MBX9934569.1 hypothetical protein [Methylobacterium sp.]
MDNIFQSVEALGLSGGDADTEITLGAPPGSDGLPGLGILSISPVTANVVRITLTDQSYVDIAIPAGQPGDRGKDGLTPTFVAGNLTVVEVNGTPGWTVRTTSTANVYAIDLSLPRGQTGPAPWKSPVPWATFTLYSPTAPADCVVLGGNAYVCITAHNSSASFDSSKWILVTTAIQGVQGSSVRVGTGAPSNSLGTDTDLYLNSTTGDLYQKVSSVYSVVANIQGAPGAVWRSGAGAPSNSLGINGDYYLNTTSQDVSQRQAGAYAVVTNLRGATGPQSWQTPPTPWAVTTTYTATAPASSVTFQGQTYVCSTSHTSGATFDSSKWVLVAAKGTDGILNGFPTRLLLVSMTF